MHLTTSHSPTSQATTSKFLLHSHRRNPTKVRTKDDTPSRHGSRLSSGMLHTHSTVDTRNRTSAPCRADCLRLQVQSTEVDSALAMAKDIKILGFSIHSRVATDNHRLRNRSMTRIHRNMAGIRVSRVDTLVRAHIRSTSRVGSFWVLVSTAACGIQGACESAREATTAALFMNQ